MHGYNAGVAVANDTLLMVYSVQSADVAQGGQNDVYGAYIRVSRNSSAKTDDSIAPDGVAANRTRRHLTFADCDPPNQQGWASLCMQEDVVSSPPTGSAGPGLNSSCSGSHLDNPTDWASCAGQRLVTVHRRWGMPGMLSLGDMWSKSQCHRWNCTHPGIGPDSLHWLGGQLAKIKPAFYNGSIAGVSLGDELASDGVPCENISAVAAFIKAQLPGETCDPPPPPIRRTSLAAPALRLCARGSPPTHLFAADRQRRVCDDQRRRYRLRLRPRGPSLPPARLFRLLERLRQNPRGHRL